MAWDKEARRGYWLSITPMAHSSKVISIGKGFSIEDKEITTDRKRLH
jgi:hypothetical protein